jgi:hypothetical protein
MNDEPNDLRYRIHIHEQGHRILRAAVDDFFTAKKLALSWVDDALPNNTVHVTNMRTGKVVGYARMGGDGGEYWTDMK